MDNIQETADSIRRSLVEWLELEIAEIKRMESDLLNLTICALHRIKGKRRNILIQKISLSKRTFYRRLSTHNFTMLEVHEIIDAMRQIRSDMKT